MQGFGKDTDFWEILFGKRYKVGSHLKLNRGGELGIIKGLENSNAFHFVK
jgi:hypothetical protein